MGNPRRKDSWELPEDLVFYPVFLDSKFWLQHSFFLGPPTQRGSHFRDVGELPSAWGGPGYIFCDGQFFLRSQTKMETHLSRGISHSWEFFFFFSHSLGAPSFVVPFFPDRPTFWMWSGLLQCVSLATEGFGVSRPCLRLAKGKPSIWEGASQYITSVYQLRCVFQLSVFGINLELLGWISPQDESWIIQSHNCN